MSKRMYKEAFERRFLKSVEVDGFYVKIDMFKVKRKKENHNKCKYEIVTSENDKFNYGEEIILKRAKSATSFIREETFTKTQLIELFASISVNDVWSAQYQTFDKSKEWQRKLAENIQRLSVDEASKFINKNFGTFGKINRTIIGHKINHVSTNNYYLVRDLAIHFCHLEKGKEVEEAENESIRNLDVNTLQFLIFNNVKYVLKSK